MIFNCKMCGGDLIIAEKSSVATCKYCRMQQTLPKLPDERRAGLYKRANEYRRNNEFDKAMALYEGILAEDTTDAEAYWSLCLCRYGIEYVEDPKSGLRIPTCHRTHFKSILQDRDYLCALEHAEGGARELYRTEAERIDAIQKNILAISAKESRFDIFISYKDSDENDERTVDSVIAEQIYHELMARGYKVFFSRITLEDKIGSAYEPYIFSALNSARLMLVVGTRTEYINAVWVRNEWSRFLEMIERGEKKTIVPCFKDMSLRDWPDEFRALQYQDMGKVGAMQDLLRGIDKIMQDDKPPRTEKKPPVQGKNENREQIRGRSVTIGSVRTIGSNDANHCWPKGEYSTDIDRDRFSVVYFHADLKGTVNKNRITCGFAIYDERNVKIFEDESQFDWAPDYSRISRGWILRGGDGTVIPAGRYRVEFWVEDSERFRTFFRVTAGRVPSVRQAPVGDRYRSAPAPERALQKSAFSNKLIGVGILALVAIVVTVGVIIGVIQSIDKGVDEPSISADGEVLYYENIGYKTVDGGVMITDYRGSETTLTLPDNIDDKAVVAIAAGAFRDQKALTTVEVPDSVTEIGEGAFGGCTSLTELILPFVGRSMTATELNTTTLGYIFGTDGTHTTAVGEAATSGDKGYTTQAPAFGEGSLLSYYCYAIPRSLRRVGITRQTVLPDYAFHNCDMIREIGVAQKVSSVGMHAFSGCSNLSGCYFEAADFAVIRGSAFANCTAFVSFSVPYGVETIGGDAFLGCTGLTDLEIADSVKTVEAGAFANCSGLTVVTVPESVTSMGYGAFSGCTSLAEITLPFVGAGLTVTEQKDTTLGYIFGDGQQLISGESATSGSVGLTAQSPDDADGNFYYGYAVPASLRRVKVTRQTAVPAYAFRNCDLIREISFDKAISAINDCAFQNCKALESGSFSITDGALMGSYAFADCDSLTSADIPYGFTSVGNDAFYGCDRLQYVNVPATVRMVGEGAFGNCPSLAEVDIAVSVGQIGASAFADCSDLTVIRYGGSQSQWGQISFGADWDRNTGDYEIFYS
ncbi:MAG: leucine-rich repeat protein [Clostridia bacterium]|nr:leucine-rich repeat protein [Clostridia bacterium]